MSSVVFTHTLQTVLKQLVYFIKSLPLHIQTDGNSLTALSLELN